MEVTNNATNGDEGGLQAMAARTKRDFLQQISKTRTAITKAPARSYALRYPDNSLWAKSIDQELDKLDENGTINWLNPAKINLLPANKKAIHMTFSFAYKRNADGTIEERK